MSFIPLSTVFEGDFTISQGSDINEYGYGDLSINRNCVIRGTSNSINASSATLVVNGGTSILKTLNAYEDINVLLGTTRLTKTQIDTTVSAFTCTGGNGISFIVGNDILFNSTGGSINLSSGKISSSAINLSNTNILGGINLSSGANGRITLTSGSDGFISTSNSGNTSIVSNNGLLDVNLNAQNNSQNLSIKLLGNTNSQLLLDSAGNNSSLTSLVFNTSNINGNMQISNNNGLGNGKIDILTGSNGFNLVTNTSGNIKMTSQNGSINLLGMSMGSNQNIDLSLLGGTDSSIILRSSGITDAIKIYTINTSGNISIIQTSNSIGKVDILTGSGGFIVNTSNTGKVQVVCNSSMSYFTNNTFQDNQNMNISVLGNTNSKLILSSEGKGLDAINIQTVSNTGGILLSANGLLNLNSNNAVQIATNVSGIPVNIGTNTSVTTINGNLNVKGTTTTINSTALTIDDNITLLNNAPSGTADSGIAIKRYQLANNLGSGDVVLDQVEETGTVSNGSNTTTTIHLSVNANSTDDYYKNWWIRIISGTGALQVRKIKAYNGSTKVATIYSTSDQNGIVPIEGLDLSVVLNNTSVYNLYICQYVMNIWDESNDEFAFVCSTDNPTGIVTINHYSNLHVDKLISNAVVTSTINGLTADIYSTITLDNTTNLPQFISDLPNNYGVYQLMIEPLIATNSCNAIIIISRINDSTTTGISNRIISSKGAHAEQINITWNANSFPQLFYKPLPVGLSGSTVFKIKIMTV
jgi:hypothetical protein